MTRYIDTFFRHKVLLCLPVVLALFVAVWYVTSQPHKYASSTSLWLDTQLPAASSIDNPSYSAPAPSAQSQSLMWELLTTRDFLTKVGHRGPLAAYLQSLRTTHKGPTALLSTFVSAIRGKSSHSVAPLDDRIVAWLGGAVSMTTPGPQVLRVTLTGPNPSITTGTLKALVDEYSDEVTTVRKQRTQAAASYYQPRLDAAAQALAKAQDAEIAYLRANPNAALAGGDPQFSQLATAAGNAQTQYTALQNTYAQINLALTTPGLATAFRVIDPPSPAFLVSRKKKAIFAGGASIVLGVVVTLLGVAALTAADTTARRREELDGLGGLEVVATIEQFPRFGPASRSVS